MQQLIVNIVADRYGAAKSPGYAAALCVRRRLRGGQTVPIAGAGGFAVYAGLPLAFSPILDGKRLHLANLSFAELHLLDVSAGRSPGSAVVTESTLGRSTSPNGPSPGG